MHWGTAIQIDAPAAVVWNTLIDVERWPDWTASMGRVERLDGDRWDLGTRARVTQPKLGTAVWEITAVEPGRSFTWQSHRPGITTIASHEILAVADGSASVTLGIDQRGALAAVIGVLFGGLTRRYIEMEAAGLKQVCETG